jgi:hypothetical protein
MDEQTKKYYQMIENDFKDNTLVKISKEYTINCTQYKNEFKIFKLFIKKENEKWIVSFNYVPIKCNYDSNLYYDYDKKMDSTENILNHLLEILWKYHMCNECFYLIEPNENLCSYCVPSKIFWEYGFYHKYTDNIPLCIICLESCYKSKLECGHFVHKTCLIKLNPNEYYEKINSDNEIKCPYCRQIITKKDKQEYFLI